MDRNIIERISEKDAKFLYETRRHPDIDKHLLGDPPETFEKHKQFLYIHQGRFRIIKTSDEKSVGYGQIKELNKYTCEVGFVIHPDFQGLGFGQQLVEEIIKEASERYLFILLFVISSNEKAIRLYEKKGFSKVNLQKDIWLMSYNVKTTSQNLKNS